VKHQRVVEARFLTLEALLKRLNFAQQSIEGLNLLVEWTPGGRVNDERLRGRNRRIVTEEGEIDLGHRRR
jgi:hypothetical protein